MNTFYEILEDKIRRKIEKSLRDQHALLPREEIDGLVEHRLGELAEKLVELVEEK